MTYRDLMLIIQDMNDEQKSRTVTIKIEDEFYSARLRIYNDESDVLDKGHHYLEVKGYEGY